MVLERLGRERERTWVPIALRQETPRAPLANQRQRTPNNQIWLPGQDSNLDWRIQSPQSYH